MTSRILWVFGLIAALAPATYSGAVKAEDLGTVSGALALTSDYRFRAVSQSNLGFAPQAEIDWNAPDGWTLTAWGSRIDFEDHQNTSIEVDLSADKRFDIGATGLDLQVFYHAYPDHHPVPDGVRYSAFEAIGLLSHRWGGAQLGGTVAWSPNNVGETGIAWLFAGAASYDLTDWLTASGDLGRQSAHVWDINPKAGFPYAYWDAGLTAHHGDVSLDIRYEDTSLTGANCAATFGGTHWCQAGAVVTVTYKIGVASQ